MRLRWLVYAAFSLCFGVLDWYFLDGLASLSQNETLTLILDQFPRNAQIIAIIGLVILNYGVWLVPVIPAAIYEMKRSHSSVKTILACILLWVMAIFSYYAYYAFLLLFFGLPNMDFMLFANRHAATYWEDFWPPFQRIILEQALEWLVIAVIGGAAVGALSARGFRFFDRKKHHKILHTGPAKDLRNPEVQ